MDYNHKFSNFNNNSYFTQTSFNPDYTKLACTNFHQQKFNQVFWVGLILINTCPNPIIMIKIIISTLHRIDGDTMPLSHIVNHLFDNHRHILLFPSNNRKINRLGK